MELWANPTGRADCGRGKSRIEEGGKSTLVPLTGDVRFEHVVFGYAASPPHPGSAGIGYTRRKRSSTTSASSGKAGTEDCLCRIHRRRKTTIINLINRFYEIKGGVITYHGIDITEIRKADLRRSLGWLSSGYAPVHRYHRRQHPVRPSGRYRGGRPTCCQIANAAFLYPRLPDGYNTVFESDGANLSQGQGRLLAIARAAISPRRC